MGRCGRKPVEIGIAERHVDFERAEQLGVLSAAIGHRQSDHDAGRAGTSGPTGTMQEVLRVGRQVEMHDAGDVVDMDAPCRHVRGDQRPRLTAPKRPQGAVALGLRAVAVDGNGLDTCPFELPGDPVGAVTGAGEHDARPDPVDDPGGDLDLLRVRHRPEMMFEPRPGDLGGHVDGDRLVLVTPDERVDVAVERCREQQRLALCVGLVDKSTHLGQEPHVGHPVGLVDHDQVDPVEPGDALVHQVGEPPGAGNGDVDATPQRGDLGFELRAAVERVDPHVTARSEPGEVATHLRGELTRGNQHQRAGPLGAGALDVRDQGHPEGDGLAAAGRRTARHVTTGQRGRNRLGLDRERRIDALPGERVDEIARHAEIGEGPHRANPTSMRLWRPIRA